MTIKILGNRNNFVGTDVLDTYSYTFKIFAKAHLRLTIKDLADVETLLVLDTDYSVADAGIGDATGGTITFINTGQAFLTAGGFLRTGFLFTMRRVLPLLQGSDIRNQGTFFPETHEDEFDRRVMVAQQQQDELDRSAKVPETTVGFDGSLPVPVANLFLRINSAGDGFDLAAGTTTGVFASVENSGVAVIGESIANFTEGIKAVRNAGAGSIEISLDFPSLTSEPAVASGDEFAFNDISASAPRERKATRNQMMADYISSLGSESTIDDADEVLILDATDTTHKRMTKANLVLGIGAPPLTRTVKTTTFTLTNSDDVILASGTFTGTLQASSGATAKAYYIANTGTGIITIDTTGADQINGADDIALGPDDSVLLIPDGTADWFIF